MTHNTANPSPCVSKTFRQVNFCCGQLPKCFDLCSSLSSSTKQSLACFLSAATPLVPESDTSVEVGGNMCFRVRPLCFADILFLRRSSRFLAKACVPSLPAEKRSHCGENKRFCLAWRSVQHLRGWYHVQFRGSICGDQPHGGFISGKHVWQIHSSTGVVEKNCLVWM